MPQYLVAIQHPNGYDGSKEGEEMARVIHTLNGEMNAAGARVFRRAGTSEHGEVTA